MELKNYIDFSNKILSVTELTNIIKELLEGSFPPVTIEGEISNYRPSSSGHVYFTLKDESACISAVMFKGRQRYLSFQPKDGMTVRAKGNLSVYPQRGGYQIIIESMEESGAGDILKMLEERKQRLAKEGLFDSANKKALPRFPKTIGVVTSPTGAALRDILQITRRRNPLVNVIIFPCAVQGEDAAPQIEQQIKTANLHNLADVLIIGRGGGSLEDLLPFSDERVVRAVAASEIPTVSAVGHEIDWAISDFAADVRAPTPSAAAELCTPVLDDILGTLDRIKKDLSDSIKAKHERMKMLIRNFSAENLEMRFRTIEQPVLLRFDDLKDALLTNMNDKCEAFKRRIETAVLQLEAANPHSILDRGYSMVCDKETGRIIRSSQEVKAGQLLEIIPKEGKISAIVTEQ